MSQYTELRADAIPDCDVEDVSRCLATTRDLRTTVLYWLERRHWPVLTVGTYRPDSEAAWRAWVAGTESHRQLHAVWERVAVPRDAA